MMQLNYYKFIFSKKKMLNKNEKFSICPYTPSHESENFSR